MDLNLNGKWALVTGGSKGIGLASAKALAAEGANIHLAARTAGDLDKAKADIAGRYNVAIETHAADLSDAVWRDAWELKIFGYIHMARMIFPAMCETGAGVIINIAGLAGRLAMPDYIAGATGNAALINFSRSLGVAGADKGVRVICINPGPTLTDRLIYLRRLTAEKEFGDPERHGELPAATRIGRPAEPEEVGDLVAFFASERAKFMTGTVIDME